jgi:alpha-1,2-mannosyltransferase
VTDKLRPAFLPSTFAMYFNMLAMSFALRQSTKRADDRVLFATICFAIGAIVGWPFSIVISFPFVFEELFVLSGDKISPALMGKWIGARWIRMLGCATLAALLLVRPTMSLHSPLVLRLF